MASGNGRPEPTSSRAATSTSRRMALQVPDTPAPAKVRQGRLLGEGRVAVGIRVATIRDHQTNSLAMTRTRTIRTACRSRVARRCANRTPGSPRCWTSSPVAQPPPARSWCRPTMSCCGPRSPGHSDGTRGLPARRGRQLLHHAATRPQRRAPAGAGQRGRPPPTARSRGILTARARTGRPRRPGSDGHRRAASGGRPRRAGRGR